MEMSEDAKKATEMVKKLREDEFLETKPEKELQRILSEPEETFCQIGGFYYDIRFIQRKNDLSTCDIYSLYFRNQGLMTHLYKSLQQHIDFEDLATISIEDIVEKSTVSVFKELEVPKITPEQTETILEQNYQKSPFAKVLINLGFRHLTFLYGIDDPKDKTQISYHKIAGRKSDQLILKTELNPNY